MGSEWVSPKATESVWASFHDWIYHDPAPDNLKMKSSSKAD